MNMQSQPPAESKSRLVYVRPILVAELPDDVRDEVGEKIGSAAEVIYAVHRPDGERLALVADRDMAFHLAVANDLAPVSVH